MAVRSVASDTAEFVAVRRCCWPASMARWLDDRGMFWPVVEQVLCLIALSDGCGASGTCDGCGLCV